jgi:hypothetical protein
MRRRLQFRLSTLFLIVTCLAVFFAVVRTTTLAGTIVGGAILTGLAMMTYGATVILEANPAWPALFVILGYLLIFAAICGGSLYLLIG